MPLKSCKLLSSWDLCVCVCVCRRISHETHPAGWLEQATFQKATTGFKSRFQRRCGLYSDKCRSMLERKDVSRRVVYVRMMHSSNPTPTTPESPALHAKLNQAKTNYINLSSPTRSDAGRARNIIASPKPCQNRIKAIKKHKRRLNPKPQALNPKP